MKILRHLAAAICGCVSALAFASPQFIAHRFDVLSAAPVSEGEIIFLGNSITNFHVWNDAFVRDSSLPQDKALIGNRGVSDGRAYQWKEKVQMILDGEHKPAKVFICIGTNDLNLAISPETVAGDVRAIVKHIQIASPQTQIFVESIPPRGDRAETQARIERTNPLLEKMAGEMGVTFIDLSSTLDPFRTNTSWTFDRLHPVANGYRAWCRFIAPQVGLECAYTDGNQNLAGFGSIAGSRASQFSLLPVSETDILMVGDYWGDAVLWHELLRNANVKNRSTANGELSDAQFKKLLDVTLKANSAQKTPRAMVLCWGMNQVNSGNFNVTTFKTTYQALVNYARQLAPGAEVYVSQVPPINNAYKANATAANAAIRDLGVPYMDIEAAGFTAANRADGVDANGMLSAKGAVMLAQAAGNLLNAQLGAGTTTAVTTDEFNAYYANRNRRIQYAAIYNTLYQAEFGDDVSQYPASAKPQFDAALAEMETVLAGREVTDAQIAAAQAKAAELTANVNMPKPDVWYVFTSSRGNKVLSTSGNDLVGTTSVPVAASMGNDVWKFVTRADGTYNIVNPLGQYITPDVAHNTAMSTVDEAPSAGWSIDYSDHKSGTFVIYSGTSAQLNQTSQAAVFNWHGGSCPNLTDEGCAYAISTFAGRLIDPDDAPNTSGWYEITRVEDNLRVVNADNVFRQSAANSYSLKYAAAPDDNFAPKGWVYIEVDGNSRYLRALNGMFINSKVTNARERANTVITAASDPVGAFGVDGWANYNNGSAEAPYVGRNSGTNKPHYFARVSDEELAAWSAWTVEIDAVAAAEIINDTKITYNGTENHGLASVYNGGVFFMTPGAVPVPEEFTVTPAVGVQQVTDTPSVIIDPETRTINVDFKAHHSAITEIDGTSATPSVIFDLQGRRVVSPRRGLYIINGKVTNL